MTTQLIHQIEERAANAWPAAIVQYVDGWRLRFSYGVTQRANSVLPNGAGGVTTLDEKLALVEDFYRRRAMPPRYQICPAACPDDLDAILAARGYRSGPRVAVQTAAIATVRARAADGESYAVAVSPSNDEAWFSSYCASEQVTAAAAEGRRGILARIGPPSGYALLRIDGQVAGVGLGVVERGWVGIFSMATQPAFRRRGVASAVLGALAAWGQQHGATQMYLQVVEYNAPALALYARMGFQTLYHYHYREASLEG